VFGFSRGASPRAACAASSICSDCCRSATCIACVTRGPCISSRSSSARRRRAAGCARWRVRCGASVRACGTRRGPWAYQARRRFPKAHGHGTMEWRVWPDCGRGAAPFQAPSLIESRRHARQ
jgi:hypothetical protein